MAAVKACSASDVPVGFSIRAVVEGVAVAIARDSEGNFHALGDSCSHEEIPLSESVVEDDEVECWAHGARFSLKTGEALSLPAFEPVPVYAVTVEGDDIYVDVTERIRAV